jgi:hypothetical protein
MHFTRRMYELRMAECIVLAALSLLLIAYVSPQQITVVIYKVSLVSLFALIGFRIDRMIFSYARPDRVIPALAPAAWIRRAIIVAASIIGGTLGV